MKTNADLQREIAETVDPDDYSSKAIHGPRVIIVREMAASLASGSLLYIACYDGTVLAPLAKHHELHGIDVSPTGLEAARKKGFITQLGDVEQGLPYPDAAFDIVHMGEALEHMIRTDYVLHELNRVLRPKGHLIVSCPNVGSPISYGLMLFADLPPYMSARYRSPHVRDFTVRTLRIALQNHGFFVEKIAGAEGSFPKLSGFINPIARHLPRLASNIIALARKDATSIFDAGKEIEERLAL